MPLATPGVLLGSMILVKNLKLSNIMSILLRPNRKLEPHPNASLQLSPQTRSLHCHWIDAYCLLDPHSNHRHGSGPTRTWMLGLKIDGIWEIRLAQNKSDKNSEGSCAMCNNRVLPDSMILIKNLAPSCEILTLSLTLNLALPQLRPQAWSPHCYWIGSYHLLYHNPNPSPGCGPDPAWNIGLRAQWI